MALTSTVVAMLTTPMPPPITTADPDDFDKMECKNPLIKDTLFYPLVLIPAALLVCFFSFTQKRKYKWLDVLSGRPGLIHPMDILTKSDRFSYVCALGATANLLYRCIFDSFQAIDYSGPLVMKTVILLVSVLIFGIVYFPVFACLTAGSLMGFGFGSAYIWMLFIMELIRMIDCDYPTTFKVQVVFRGLPNIMCLLYLSIRIPYKFYQDFPNRSGLCTNVKSAVQQQYTTLKDLRGSNLGRHVMDLLKKPNDEEVREGFKAKVVGFLLDHTYRPHPRFRFSARFMSTLFLALLLLYAVSFQFFRSIFYVHKALKSFLPLIPPEHEKEARQLFKYVTYTLLASGIISILLGLYGVVRMFTQYRVTMFALNRGELKHLWRNKTNDYILLSAMKYSGYQVVSVVWGFIIHLLVFLIVCSIVAGITWAFNHGYSSWFTDKVLQLWPIPFWALIINVTQILMTKFTFIGHKKHLVLDNRRILFIASYFIFFYNIFLGIFSSLLRIVKSIVIGAILLPRLDSCVLPQDFDSMDPGFMTYVGFMRLENDHNHPVMLGFIRLLQILARDRRAANRERDAANGFGGGGDGGGARKKDIDKIEKSRKRRAILFKWSTLYTLINNPDLRLDRKGYMQRIKLAKELGLAIPKSDTYVTIGDDVLKEAQANLEGKQGTVIGKIANAAGDKFVGIRRDIQKKIWDVRNKSSSMDNLDETDGGGGGGEEEMGVYNGNGKQIKIGHYNDGDVMDDAVLVDVGDRSGGGGGGGDISSVFAGNKRRRRMEKEVNSDVDYDYSDRGPGGRGGGGGGRDGGNAVGGRPLPMPNRGAVKSDGDVDDDDGGRNRRWRPKNDKDGYDDRHDGVPRGRHHRRGGDDDDDDGAGGAGGGGGRGQSGGRDKKAWVGKGGVIV